MDAFETSLKAAFAELPEPEDTGFTAQVATRVAKRERSALFAQVTQRVGFAAAGAAIVYGASQLVQAMGPQLMATFGLELARAHGALSQATFTVGLTQVLVVAAALAGGAVAYRTTVQD